MGRRQPCYPIYCLDVFLHRLQLVALFYLFFGGMRAFFEWKYVRKEKKYLISILWGMGFLIALAILWLINKF